MGFDLTCIGRRTHLIVLTGQDLLDFVKANQDSLNENELAEQAGYTREVKGKFQILTKAFNNALHEATGSGIRVGKAPGKVAGYQTTIHANGIALVGQSYVQEAGFEPGMVLRIVVDPDGIHLLPTTDTKAPRARSTKKEAVAA